MKNSKAIHIEAIHIGRQFIADRHYICIST